MSVTAHSLKRHPVQLAVLTGRLFQAKIYL